jgi:UDP-GlcNAc:undecaprenyl-phosphate/decaprenyl-phosphate GlcNAc-1-phosphate transferase
VGCLISSLVTWAACILLVRNGPRHHLALDDKLDEPQKLHRAPIPRVGGIAIAVGMLAGAAAAYFSTDLGIQPWLVILCVIPGFIWGLIEDLSKRGAVMARLILTGTTPMLAFVLIDARLTEIGLPFVDQFLALHAVSFVFTVFAVTGLAHAINVIDGLNGLAGATTLLASIGLGLVAWIVGDQLVVMASSVLAGSIVGFLLLNYPKGKLFLGDGGAYLLGLLLAVLSVLLVQHNPEVSVWFPMMLLAYPVTETLYSAYRRRRRGQSPGSADALHLHSLVYHRIVRWAGPRASDADRLTRNSLASVVMWVLPMICTFLAILFWDKTLHLQAAAVFFVALYLVSYLRIIRFRIPTHWIIRRSELKRCETPQINVDTEQAAEVR